MMPGRASRIPRDTGLAEGIPVKTSTKRILTTHVGSMPRPESIRALLRARLNGESVDEAELSARVPRP